MSFSSWKLCARVPPTLLLSFDKFPEFSSWKLCARAPPMLLFSFGAGAAQVATSTSASGPDESQKLIRKSAIAKVVKPREI